MKVIIASAIRTPIAAFQGSFSSLKASELGAIVIKAAIEKASVSAHEVDLVIMGNVLAAGMGQAPARQATLYAGLSQTTPTVTLNKVCGSGLESIIQAARAVALGDAKVVVAGGMESHDQLRLTYCLMLEVVCVWVIKQLLILWFMMDFGMSITVNTWVRVLNYVLVHTVLVVRLKMLLP